MTPRKPKSKPIEFSKCPHCGGILKVTYKEMRTYMVERVFGSIEGTKEHPYVYGDGVDSPKGLKSFLDDTELESITCMCCRTKDEDGRRARVWYSSSDFLWDCVNLQQRKDEVLSHGKSKGKSKKAKS